MNGTARNLTYDPAGGMPPEADYALMEQPEGTDLFGENHAFWFFDEQNRAHGYTHTEAFQDFYELRAERFWLTLPDGRIFYTWGDGFRGTRRAPAGANLVMTCIEPFRHWSIDFFGSMRLSDAEELAQGRPIEGSRPVVRLHIDVEIAAEPWRLGSLGMKDNPFAASFFGENRYEQLCRFTGWARIEKEEPIRLSGMAMRTHRRGSRRMKGWHGHSWQTALFPSGRGFGFERFPDREGPQGRADPAWSEGYILDDGRIVPAEILESAWLTELRATGEPLVIRLRAGGEEHVIRGTTVATVWRTIQAGSTGDRNVRRFGIWGRDGDYVMGQGVTLWEWDGEKVYGHTERSTLTTELLPGRG